MYRVCDGWMLHIAIWTSADFSPGPVMFTFNLMLIQVRNSVQCRAAMNYITVERKYSDMKFWLGPPFFLHCSCIRNLNVSRVLIVECLPCFVLVSLFKLAQQKVALST
ncbi:hypothetical protein ILYODFUR_022929 [Ilyodon furcidens]|uniref:Secreted protein n=1 Tax=Ilyodon furcidens TaxID=33524 RepID=A0ABV0TWY2_9TELE